MADLTIEKRVMKAGKGPVAGCDEAGRGSWAGPIVAAAVILPDDVSLPGVDDSKKINKKNHRALAEMIMERAVAVGIGVAGNGFIDEHGIGFANKYVIEQAVNDLSIRPGYLLIDGGTQQEISTDIKQEEIAKGDQKSLSIAAASIIAKSVHDELMKRYAKEYPEYKWNDNVGYGTMDHKCAIQKHGVCELHRKSFKPIREAIAKRGENKR